MISVTIGLFVYLLGVCVGSFLNVVVYRLPRGLSLYEPTWSFCPSCQTILQWYDNIPVLGWLLLKGRCRYCKEPISPQYPLVEAVTGLAFVLVYYLLFVVDCRVLHVTEASAVSLVAGWPTDVCLLLAWLVLAAVLIACSAMDLALYVVDTRVTNTALYAGIALYMLWPRPDFFAERASGPLAAAMLAAFLVSGIMLWRSNRLDSSTEQEELDLGSEPGEGEIVPPSTADNLATVLAIVIFVGIATWLLVGSAQEAPGRGLCYQLAVPAAMIGLFIVMVLAGGQQREVDDELHATIEAEAPEARGVALRELLWLTPAAVAAIVTYLAVRYLPIAGECWLALTDWNPIGGLVPVGGAAFAVHGAIIAAAAGWGIRIFFTCAFGREAFGTGDIYILAAAGAAGGYDIALLGFLFSVPIALLGWIVSLVLKRTGMIPFGPPLAIGFLMALWLNGQAAVTAAKYYDDLVLAWEKRPDILLLGMGILLIVMPISIMLAKLTRRLVEPD